MGGVLENHMIHIFDKYRPNVMSYTGTSMAAPSVWGYIADMVQKKMVKEGLSAEEIWPLKDYSPESLIKAVKAKTVGLDGDSKSPYRLLPEKEIRRVKRGRGSKDIIEALKEAKKKAELVNEGPLFESLSCKGLFR